MWEMIDARGRLRVELAIIKQIEEGETNGE
jgi:hypothetical protein